ncbi:MAG: P63C domain-containing protein, partial [Candidatus Acidiferrales bacterium]
MEEEKEAIDGAKAMSALGATKGGLARAKALSPERRSEIARAAVEARWAKEGKVPLPKATHEGLLDVGDIVIPCAVLENGQRVLTQSGLMKALGRARQAKGREYYDADVNMPAFLTAKNLKPFISPELGVTSSQIEFRTVRGMSAFGYPAELLPKVCGVFLDADDAGALTKGQKHIAVQARVLIRGLAHVGIIALVDEATGYQDERSRDALAKILEAFIAKELRPWVRTFPTDFYKEMFRLRQIPYRSDVKRPQYIGVLTNDLVYARLAPGVLE